MSATGAVKVSRATYFVSAVASPGSTNDTCSEFAHFLSSGFSFFGASRASLFQLLVLNLYFLLLGESLLYRLGDLLI